MQLITFDPKNLFTVFLLFLGGCFSFEPPQPVSVTTPTVITNPDIPGHAFIIELRKDKSVWYAIHDPETENPLKKINAPVRKNLGYVIAEHKKQHTGEKLTFLVKGHPDSEYKQFENVIGALKDNEEFKYNLVTDQEEN